MATITKEKNYLIFTNDKNNTYKFDINTATFYSTKGNVMKSVPSGFTTCLRNNSNRTMVMTYMYHKHYYNSVKYTEMQRYTEGLAICDKLDSIGFYKATFYNLNEKNLSFIGKNFKAFAKAFKENPNLELSHFIENYGKEQFLIGLGLKVDEHYTSDILNMVWSWRDMFNKKQLKQIAYYLSRGVYDFFDNGRYNRVDYSYFENFYKWSALVGYEPTKDDFFRQYINVKRTYQTNKKQYDNESIVYQLAKHSKAWEYENDEFCIIVPQTVDEFKAEADAQNNCVYNMYLERVIKGDTNVIFIRKKENPTQSFITCEVDNKGRIRQYLAKNNCYVYENTNEYKFKEELIEYLNKVWSME